MPALLEHLMASWWMLPLPPERSERGGPGARIEEFLKSDRNGRVDRQHH